MNSDEIQSNVDNYKNQGKILDAAEFLIQEFGLNDPNLAGLDFREELSADSVLLTTEGDLGKPQIVKIPRNLFDFDLKSVLNLLAHEMLHVQQRASGKLIEDRNEREFQAYYEMLFHKIFPKIPNASHFFQKQIVAKALDYYQKMGAGTELQLKYTAQKLEIEDYLENISI